MGARFLGGCTTGSRLAGVRITESFFFFGVLFSFLGASAIGCGLIRSSSSSIGCGLIGLGSSRIGCGLIGLGSGRRATGVLGG